MFKLAQDFGEFAWRRGGPGRCNLIGVLGEVAAGGSGDESLLAKDAQRPLHSRGRDAEPVGQPPNGVHAAGLDNASIDLLPKGLGRLLVGLPWVIVCDCHAKERTH